VGRFGLLAKVFSRFTSLAVKPIGEMMKQYAAERKAAAKTIADGISGKGPNAISVGVSNPNGYFWNFNGAKSNNKYLAKCNEQGFC